MSVRDVLVTAREKIAKGWTRGVLARDATGTRVPVKDSMACSYCAVGAVVSAAGCGAAAMNQEAVDAIKALETALPLEYASSWDLPDFAVARYNDGHAKDENDVLALFDRAIAAQAA